MTTQVIVRSTPPRAHIVESLKAQIPELIVCEDANFLHPTMSGDEKGHRNFLAALRISGLRPTIHMEDDIALCSNWRQRVEAEIEPRQFDVIQFFSMRKADLTLGSRYDNHFCMTQCFYLPGGVGAGLLEYEPTWTKQNPDEWAYDLMLGDYLRSRKEKYWIVVPSLVNHLPIKSVTNPRRSSKRQSLTFAP